MSYMFGRYRVQVNDFVHTSIFKLQGVGSLNFKWSYLKCKKDFGVAFV